MQLLLYCSTSPPALSPYRNTTAYTKTQDHACCFERESSDQAWPAPTPSHPHPYLLRAVASSKLDHRRLPCPQLGARRPGDLVVVGVGESASSSVGGRDFATRDTIRNAAAERSPAAAAGAPVSPPSAPPASVCDRSTGGCFVFLFKGVLLLWAKTKTKQHFAAGGWPVVSCRGAPSAMSWLPRGKTFRHNTPSDYPPVTHPGTGIKQAPFGSRHVRSSTAEYTYICVGEAAGFHWLDMRASKPTRPTSRLHA